MNQTLHRSDNLLMTRAAGTPIVQVELRFPTSMVKGEFDSTCPRCGVPGKPEQWEIEGPDGRSNTVWLGCSGECASQQNSRWSRSVDFNNDWIDIG